MDKRRPSNGTQKRRSDLSSSRLLRAAARLIADKGYARTSLVQIAAEAGYSHGLVTVRFGSKDGLLRALFDRMTRDWTERELKPAIQGRLGLEAFEAILDVTRAAIRRNPTNVRALYALMFEAVLGVSVLEDRVRGFHLSQRRMYRAILLEGVRAGRIRGDINADQYTSLVVSLIRGASYQWLLEPTYDIDEALASILDVLKRLLSPDDHSSTGEGRDAKQTGRRGVSARVRAVS